MDLRACLNSCMVEQEVVAQELTTAHLCSFAPREGNAVMVCTDSAARGLDIRGISHVIQAEFSMSAVDFLHRAGRTARAGAKGRMTSLYTEADAPLANAIRSAIDKGLPVVGSPSAANSFANNSANPSL